MPTAAEYTEGATWWRQAADDVARFARQVPRSLPLSSLSLCPVRNLLDDTLDVTELSLGNVSDEFTDLAAECVRRSGVCLAYDIALSNYRTRLNSWNAGPEAERGARPIEPDKPYPWVEPSI